MRDRERAHVGPPEGVGIFWRHNRDEKRSGGNGVSGLKMASGPALSSNSARKDLPNNDRAHAAATDSRPFRFRVWRYSRWRSAVEAIQLSEKSPFRQLTTIVCTDQRRAFYVNMRPGRPTSEWGVIQEQSGRRPVSQIVILFQMRCPSISPTANVLVVSLERVCQPGRELHAASQNGRASGSAGAFGASPPVHDGVDARA